MGKARHRNGQKQRQCGGEGWGKREMVLKAVRNKAKFDKREKEKHRTVTGITNRNQSERVLHV